METKKLPIGRRRSISRKTTNGNYSYLKGMKVVLLSVERQVLIRVAFLGMKG
jgi:hypothetical protein